MQPCSVTLMKVLCWFCRELVDQKVNLCGWKLSNAIQRIEIQGKPMKTRFPTLTSRIRRMACYFSALECFRNLHSEIGCFCSLHHELVVLLISDEEARSILTSTRKDLQTQVKDQIQQKGPPRGMNKYMKAFKPVRKPLKELLPRQMRCFTNII